MARSRRFSVSSATVRRAMSACVRTVASGVRTRCAASAMKSSDRRMDWPSRSIRLFRDAMSGASSSGALCSTRRRSEGPRRETAAAISCSGLSDVRAAMADRIAAMAKKATDRTAARRDNPAAIRSTPVRVWATVTVTGTASAPARTARETEAIRIGSASNDPVSNTTCPVTGGAGITGRSA
jgi:hypothetical protein